MNFATINFTDANKAVLEWKSCPPNRPALFSYLLSNHQTPVGGQDWTFSRITQGVFKTTPAPLHITEPELENKASLL